MATLSGNLCTGGTVLSYGTEQGGYEATKAFDGDSSTGCSISGSDPVGIGYQFASPVNIRCIGVQRNNVGDASFPYTLQYSDDGSSWNNTNIVNQSSIAYNYGKPFVYYNCNDYGAHAYWRLLRASGTAWLQFTEIQMFAGKVLPLSKDNHIASNTTTKNFGAATNIYLMSYTTPLYRYGLISIDITGLTKVSQAILRLYCGYVNLMTGKSVNIQRFLYQDCEEGTGDNSGSDSMVSNYNQYKTGTNWNTAGCNGSGTDYTTTHQKSLTITGASAWHSIDIADLLNDAITAGQTTLNLILRIADTSTNALEITFNSRHNDNAPLLEYELYNWTAGKVATLTSISKVMTLATTAIKSVAGLVNILTTLYALKDNYMRQGISTYNWGNDANLVVDASTVRKITQLSHTFKRV
ncbi:MAG: hypothetical protein CSYNP_01575 [Syntrophus sp. SKADARSKE-3]|nr:hypothetical protein [Syntrophus sp. SKADARSKE-3]